MGTLGAGSRHAYGAASASLVVSVFVTLNKLVLGYF